jgi:uncharacterized protein (DUF1800 family)
MTRLWVVLMCGCAAAPAPPARSDSARKVVVTLPATSLSEPERVTHALSRLAFGPSAADRQRIAAMGLEGWLSEQLAPGTDPAMDERLSGFKTLDLSVAEALRDYPRPDQRLKAMGLDPASVEGQEATRRLVREAPEELPRQLLIELTQAKLLRAATSKRQFEEVMVDFWFNHFNVSAEKNRVRWMVNAWEREAIRPHVFGRFRDLLGATAKHPAMLWYLDNWMSVRDGFELPAAFRKSLGDDAGPRRAMGLNENYARELLELHTVGVNAGYTQADVREAARALTGWGLEIRQRQRDFGRFEFHRLAHDDGPKRVFGLELPAGLGQDDGERLLDHLARHPATARHLATKLCQRLVSEQPPPALVERVAATFLRTDGDLTETYRAIIESPEFWSRDHVGTLTRTPLEFVVGAVRAVGTLDEVQRPLAAVLDQLGQPLYRCPPPTGYPEHGAHWISAGALVSRINFGLRLATGRIPGVVVALPPKDTPVDALARQVLGRPASASTIATVERALRQDDEVDERRAPQVAKVVGLLLGSPEFQKQ